MISVKGAKAEAAGADAADPYRLQVETRGSRTPLLIGAFLAAVVLYVKTALASTPEPAPAGPKPKAPDDGQSPATEGSLVASPPAAEPAEPEQAEETSPRSEVLGLSAPAAAEMPGNFSPTAVTAEIPAAVEPGPALSSLAEPALAFADARVADAGSVTKADGADRPAAEAPNAVPKSDRAVFLENVSSGNSILISAADLLAHARDDDGDALGVLSATASSGSLVKTSAGYLFRADDDSLGPVQIKYLVTDGAAVIEVTAQLEIVTMDFLGTSGDNDMAGSSWRDEVLGLEGNDVIRGLGGSDFLEGDGGSDTISGGTGDDAIGGGDGSDTLEGGIGDDGLTGGNGNDFLLGDSGDDILFGDGGADALSDGIGADAVYGGHGNDTVLAAMDGESDLLAGDAGLDTLDYSAASGALEIDLNLGFVTGIETGADLFSGFETIIGGSADDHFVIGNRGVTVSGGQGDNTFEFAPAAPGQSNVQTLHQITDFGVGDIIQSPRFDIFSSGTATDPALFEAMLGNSGVSPAGGSIRFRLEGYEEADRKTIIEWDNDDSSQQTVVTIIGHQVLTWTENGV